MSALGGADGLSEVSRNFYENTKIKTASSILLAAYSLFLLAFTCMAGANCTNIQMNQNAAIASNDDLIIEAQNYKKVGFGFAALFYFIGFIFALAASLYISPIVSGLVG